MHILINIGGFVTKIFDYTYYNVHINEKIQNMYTFLINKCVIVSRRHYCYPPTCILSWNGMNGSYFTCDVLLFKHDKYYSCGMVEFLYVNPTWKMIWISSNVFLYLKHSSNIFFICTPYQLEDIRKIKILIFNYSKSYHRHWCSIK